MTEIERALSDIAEVRDRLAMTQRFKGYSGFAAIGSGLFAIAAGAVQAVLVPTPSGARECRLYFVIWLVCCAASALLNYGAIAHWFANDANARERWQTRTVGLSILPSLLLGAALSFASIDAGYAVLLPGIWYGCYAVGLFASRTLVPRGVVAVASALLAVGIALLFAPPAVALSWWVPAAGFGAAQITIGALVLRDRLPS